MAAPIPVTAGFNKSSYSGASNGCVGIKREGDEVSIMDTKLGKNSPVLVFSAESFASLMQHLTQ